MKELCGWNTSFNQACFLAFQSTQTIGSTMRPQNMNKSLEDRFDTIPVKRGKGKCENSSLIDHCRYIWEITDQIIQMVRF